MQRDQERATERHMDTQALIRLWNLTQEHPGTSGAETAVRVLLGLYNGPRFRLDLTELRRLDNENVDTALAVISADAHRPAREVHQWLNLITGRTDFGLRFERLAFEYRIKGRCKRDQLQDVKPGTLIIDNSASTAA